MYDPSTEPTRQINLTPWEIAKLYHSVNTPAAAVYGVENNLRMVALYSKLSTVMQQFIDAGQIEPATRQPIKPGGGQSSPVSRVGGAPEPIRSKSEAKPAPAKSNRRKATP